MTLQLHIENNNYENKQFQILFNFSLSSDARLYQPGLKIFEKLFLFREHGSFRLETTANGQILHLTIPAGIRFLFPETGRMKAMMIIMAMHGIENLSKFKTFLPILQFISCLDRLMMRMLSILTGRRLEGAENFHPISKQHTTETENILSLQESLKENGENVICVKVYDSYQAEV